MSVDATEKPLKIKSALTGRYGQSVGDKKSKPV